jgi:hypothetical protein
VTAPAAPAPHQGPLPRGLRFAAFVCLVLSAFTGFFALSECLGLSQLEDTRTAANFSLVGDPALDARIAKAQLSALRSLRESRALFLGALSVVCSLAFVSAGRLLRPDGLPLERMRRMLAGSTLAAALLRTIDGAQGAVVARRMGPIIADALKTLPEFQGPTAAPLEVVAWMLPATTMGFTALIAGAFAVLGQYFQSERVRQAIHLRDGRLANED